MPSPDRIPYEERRRSARNPAVERAVRLTDFWDREAVRQLHRWMRLAAPRTDTREAGEL